MAPKLLRVDQVNPEPEHIAQAAAVILRGGLVAFPTETVYGLGANALDEAAVARIFVAKDRPVEDPLIVHLSSLDDLPAVVRTIPEAVTELAKAFWPGPLTLILPKSQVVPANVTAGLDTVAVRVPAHPVAQALLRACRRPIAAPSANRFGYTSPTTAAHVLEDLGGRVDLILDGGATTIGVESTVLDLTRTPPVILRPGGLTREKLAHIIGPVKVQGLEQVSPGPQLSPGLLDSHYAPRARLIICVGNPLAALEKINLLAARFQESGRHVGLLLADEDKPSCQPLGASLVTLGPAGDLAQIARNLFAGLRALDQLGVDVILARNFAAHGLGLAINDRLIKAATQVVHAEGELK